MWHSRPPRDPPPPFMANTILNFHFDYWNPSLTYWLGFLRGFICFKFIRHQCLLNFVHLFLIKNQPITETFSPVTNSVCTFSMCTFCVWCFQREKGDNCSSSFPIFVLTVNSFKIYSSRPMNVMAKKRIKGERQESLKKFFLGIW